MGRAVDPFGTQLIGRTDSIGFDVATGFVLHEARFPFGGDTLPTRTENNRVSAPTACKFGQMQGLTVKIAETKGL